jgi:hypothetical protein
MNKSGSWGKKGVRNRFEVRARQNRLKVARERRIGSVLPRAWSAAEAKFWLAPVRLAWNRGFSAAELRRIEGLTEENEDRLLEIWNEYFDIGE